MKKNKSRLFYSIVLLGIINFAAAQNLTIKGSIADLNQNIEIVEFTEDGTKTIKSIPVENGIFSDKFEVGTEPKKYRIKIFQLLVATYLEPGTLTITGDMTDYKTIKFSGLKTVDEYAAYREEHRAAQKAEEAKDGAKFGISESAALRAKFNKQWVAAHPDSYVAFDLIAELYNNYDEVKAYYDFLSPKLKASSRGIALKEKMETMKRGAKGMEILNFTLKDVDGKDVNIQSYKGKYVLIDFWASWCKPCRAENPNVLAAYNKYKDKNFTVLSVSIDDSPEKWKAAIKEDGLPWTQVRDRENKKSKVMDYYNINAIPSTFLIDKNGIIIAQDLRGGALEEKLTEVLK
ncbi:TlpA disulfide reductase family protein [Flavobacterium luteolum]|uniref:TlpA disulfide reductase family protein n=1 Tax=Flavobacterium luteolum TaxID=3003259 RepID=UPI00248D7E30|nr:TlpA disulfide reductase family protein [Flavobacterium luteolum]